MPGDAALAPDTEIFRQKYVCMERAKVQKESPVRGASPDGGVAEIKSLTKGAPRWRM